MKPVEIPADYNYMAVFLTMSCTLHCSYCINRFGEVRYQNDHLTGEQWVAGLNRLVSNGDLPVTLQGGEPSLHPDFYYILNNIKKEMHIDILTNLEVDIDEFMEKVQPDRIKRIAPYASIRVSYHPEYMDLDHLASKVIRLQSAGYSIGIWGVLHPLYEHEIYTAQEYCKGLGIDFRTKEFLGKYEGRLFGTFKYPDACDKKVEKHAVCRTTELIIGPEGGIYRCHSDLYSGRSPVGNILDPEYEIKEIFRDCDSFGQCNPCDVKIKTNRFQEFGHTSVEIRVGTERQ